LPSPSSFRSQLCSSFVWFWKTYITSAPRRHRLFFFLSSRLNQQPSLSFSPQLNRNT
jgi:hypothetical protein